MLNGKKLTFFWTGVGWGWGDILDDCFREIVHILFKFSLNGSKTPCRVTGSDLCVDLLELQLAFSELIPPTLWLAWQVVLIRRWRWDTREPAGHRVLLFNGQSFPMPCGLFCNRRWFVLVCLGWQKSVTVVGATTQQWREQITPQFYLKFHICVFFEKKKSPIVTK